MSAAGPSEPIFLLDALRKSEAFLARKGISPARVDVEHIFAHVLGGKRLDLYLHPERPLSDAEQDAIRRLIQRRGQRFPLQYLLGTVEFGDLELICDERSLIPRPETEALVEIIADRLPSPPASVIDIGTGSGCLALALALRYPEARIQAVDTSEDALGLARENAERNHLTDRIDFVSGDLLAGITTKADLIVSNPPYLSEAEWAEAEPEVRDHEPKVALVGDGSDGGDCLRAILPQARERLNPGGWLFLETGIDQHPNLTGEAARLGFVEIESLRDFHRRHRYLQLRAPSDS